MSVRVRPGIVRRARHSSAALTGIVLACLLATQALGLSWLSNTPLTKSGGAWAYPGGLAVSSSTVAHAIYEQRVLGTWAVHYRRTTNSGASWSVPIVLSRPGVGEAGVPVIDAGGSAVDAVWIEGEDVIAGTDSAIVYRRSTDAGATWRDARQLSPLFETAGYPHVARQGSRVVILWTNQLNGRVYARVSTDGGATFRSRTHVATTVNKPFGGSLYEAFPTVAFGTGVIYVGYYTAAKTFKIRRSTDGATTWKTAQTIATNAAGWGKASIAATGSTVLAGYAVQMSTDYYTVIRRSIDKGTTWGSVISLSPASSYPSFQPVLVYRGGFRAIFERCLSNSCSSSKVYYRSSSSGGTWSTTLTASVRRRSWGSPADVDVATKVLVLYIDANSSAADVYVRRGG